MPLLIKMMVGMGLQQVMDNQIPSHWKQRSLSWGWTAVIWLAYILSEGDHRKVVVREFVRELGNRSDDGLYALVISRMPG